LKKVRRNKLHIISLGCSKNLIDSEVMGGLLAQSGLELVEESDDADIILVNTCAFIKDAKEEAIEEILTLADKKKRGGQDFRLVVAGCLAQRYGSELADQIPEVDLFVGTGEVGNIVSHISRLKERSAGKLEISTPDFLMSSKQPRVLSSKSVSTYLKISDGCSNCCTYCVIPSIRGTARSREKADILREARNLASRGIKEIIITAQDTTSYGRDLKSRPRLSRLLNDLTKIRGIEWLRLLYAHPAHITTDVLETIAADKKICRYIDLPVQHIDDAVLSAMNRKVTSARIFELIDSARRIIPDVAIRTSLIVGFPGETQKRFERLLDFVRTVKFDHLGVFTYSREEGTGAAGLKSQIPEKEKERRRETIMNEQAAISHAINRTLIGRDLEVLIEEASDRPDFAFMGRCRRQAPEIDGVTYVQTGSARIGEIIKCRITGADDYDLFAEIPD
jgi:ribosomal protein S12 methylthiotransferase